MAPMADLTDVPHPYSIEVAALEKPAGYFGWALRRSGKLIERSDRPQATEQKAYANALTALERNLAPSMDRRG